MKRQMDDIKDDFAMRRKYLNARYREMEQLSIRMRRQADKNYGALMRIERISEKSKESIREVERMNEMVNESLSKLEKNMSSMKPRVETPYEYHARKAKEEKEKEIQERKPRNGRIRNDAPTKEVTRMITAIQDDGSHLNKCWRRSARAQSRRKYDHKGKEPNDTAMEGKLSHELEREFDCRFNVIYKEDDPEYGNDHDYADDLLRDPRGGNEFYNEKEAEEEQAEFF